MVSGGDERPVSKRSERALRKTSILEMNPAKWLQTATSTTELTSCLIKNTNSGSLHHQRQRDGGQVLPVQGESQSVSARLEEDEHTRDKSREMDTDLMATFH